MKWRSFVDFQNSLCGFHGNLGGAHGTSWYSHVLLLVVGIPAYTFFIKPSPRFLSTEMSKNPRPRTASERTPGRGCSGAYQNPEAPQRIQNEIQKPAAFTPKIMRPQAPGALWALGPERGSRKTRNGLALPLWFRPSGLEF